MMKLLMKCAHIMAMTDPAYVELDYVRNNER